MSEDTQHERQLTAWMEEIMGVKVARCEPVSRWRPSWIADVNKQGKSIPLYIKGWRALDSFVPERYSLEYEAGVYKVLKAQGIPTPQVYGVCKDPYAIVMERMPGQHLIGNVDSVERNAVLEHCGELWAKLHQIEVGKFSAIGMRIPTSPEDTALSFHNDIKQLYERTKPAPDPRIAFRNRWLSRNVPKGRGQTAFLQCDSGQFLFQNGRVTALIDFEMACIGDPLWDLAKLRIRAIPEGIDNLSPFFRAYERESGESIDWRALLYHTVNVMSVGGMQVSSTLAKPDSNCAYDEYLAWYLIGLIVSLETMAEYMGFDLETVSPAPPYPRRWAPALEIIAKRKESENSNRWDAELDKRLIALAQRTTAVDSDKQYIDDVSQLLGTPVYNWKEADEKLEKFVLSAGTEYDKELVKIFYRWTRRQVPLVKGLLTKHDLRNDLFTTPLQSLNELQYGRGSAS